MYVVVVNSSNRIAMDKRVRGALDARDHASLTSMSWVRGSQD